MAETGGALSVLIAERHRTFAGSLARIIEALGNATVAAEVNSAEAALAIAQKLSPAVAIVDLELSIDCSLVSALRASCPDTRVIVMAERLGADPQTLVAALASGAVGAIYKDSSFEELARALGSNEGAPVVAGEVAGLLLHSYIDSLADKRLRDKATIEALAAAVEVRDLTTGQHLNRVGELATRCMQRIDPDLARNEEVQFGFMLHDIGKIGIPDAILNKAGPLEDDEWTVMRRHPEMGVKIVQPIGFSDAATDIILCHHERCDGSGYPFGLKGNEIPITARTFAVADTFDAMTSDRPYRRAMEREQALAAIAAESGTLYDPHVVEVFLDLTQHLAA